ncbi:MAG: hypothetical protein BKP49_04365 [Treponema sp. CETP13]|nr:MAG: hypothetical protein BKP49_04365 [Treponema sp. CETP13]
MALQDFFIRPTHMSDVPSLYRICLLTANNGVDASALFSDSLLVGHYYAAPYFFYSPQLCYSAVLQGPKKSVSAPLGYIIACSDTVAFSRWMVSQWLPILQPHYAKTVFLPKSSMEEKIQELILDNTHPGFCTKNASILKNYPAQFHIDILPELQKKGCGKILIETLLHQLKENHICGVHLGVSKENSNAVGFYEAMGFAVLEELSWGYVMGKQL